MLLKSLSPVMSRANKLTLAESMVDFWGGGIAVAGKIQPVNGNNTATLTGAVDSRKFRFLMAVLQVGVNDEVVDFKLRCSETSGGSYDDVSGKAATQIAGTGDNNIKVIFVRYSELPSDHPFVKASVTVGNGTSSLVSCLILGIDPLTEAVVDVDDAQVSEIVGGSAYRGAKAFFFTNEVTLTELTVLGGLTISALASTGVNLDSWEGPVLLPNGSAAMHHNVSAIAGVSPTSETLKGIAVVAADGTTLLHAERFPGSGVPITAEGHGVVYELLLPLPAALPTGYTA